MRKFFRVIAKPGLAPVSLGLLLSLGACTATGPEATATARPAEHWVTFKDQTQAGAEVPPVTGIASLVLVRPATGSAIAVNVFIDGEYATSLLPGAARELAVCAGDRRIALAFTDVGRRYKDKDAPESLTIAKLVRGQKQFVEVVESASGAEPKAQPISADEAARLTASAKWQNHSLPRIDTSKCMADAKRAS